MPNGTGEGASAMCLLPFEEWEKVPEGRMRALDQAQNFAIDRVMANLDAQARDRARNLRKDDTQAERLLWEALRARRLSGFKFVRQLSVGPYFADFACRECKLIVEIDGASHGTEGEMAHDRKRTEFLAVQGWRVHRAWNQDVFTNLNGVCDSLLLVLTEGK